MMDGAAQHRVDPLAYRVGGATVGENLARAVAAGQLVAHDDGTWELRLGMGTPGRWLTNGRSWDVPCRSMNRFVFNLAYGRRQVPWHCRNCYKVKIQPRSLRQLLAVRRLFDAVQWATKCGLDIATWAGRGVYGGFVYCDGLEVARRAWHALRAQVDAAPQLGPDVPMRIKRGCTDYEMACGPSDRYRFDPAQEAVECWLVARLRPAPPQREVPMRMAILDWAKFAFQIGDETYRDVVGPQDPHPGTVAYDPGPPV